MHVERIHFERTGGFAGLRLAADFKLDELTEEQVDTLTELLDDLDFAELPKNLTAGASATDEFTYTITVEAVQWKHTVVTGESPDNKKMHELLQFLNRLLRTQKKKQ